MKRKIISLLISVAILLQIISYSLYDSENSYPASNSNSYYEQETISDRDFVE